MNTWIEQYPSAPIPLPVLVGANRRSGFVPALTIGQPRQKYFNQRLMRFIRDKVRRILPSHYLFPDES